MERAPVRTVRLSRESSSASDAADRSKALAPVLSAMRGFAELGRTSTIIVSAIALTSVASAQTQEPVKPAPVPGGVVPLPQGPPPTTQQAPVPYPAQPLPPGLKPLSWSPDLSLVRNYVAGRPITMQQAIAIALYTSRPFASAVTSLEAAAARTGQANDLMLPNAGVSGQVTEYDAPTVIDIGGQAFTAFNQFNPVFTGAISLPLDVFGTLHSAFSQAQFNEIAAKIDVNRVRNQTVYDVKTAFYNALRAQAQLSVATDNLNNALERLSDAQKNYAAGVSSRFDVITSQRDVANAQQALITAKAQISVNLAALKNVMGLDLTTRLNLTDAGAVEYPPGVAPPVVSSPASSEPNQEKIAPAPPRTAPEAEIPRLPAPQLGAVQDDFDWGPEFPALLNEALHHRPEVLEAEAHITANQKGMQFAKRSILPSFSLSAQDVYTPNATEFPPRKNQGIFTLGFSIPLYDGGLARDRVREQEADEAQAEIDRRNAADQVQVDLQEAYLTLVQARQRVAVANVEVAQAQESFRVSLVRYRAGVSQQTGVSPQVELSNAQISLTQAGSNQVDALYDYNNARAQLDRALGRYAFTGQGPGYPDVPGRKVTGQSAPPRK